MQPRAYGSLAVLCGLNPLRLTIASRNMQAVDTSETTDYGAPMDGPSSLRANLPASPPELRRGAVKAGPCS